MQPIPAANPFGAPVYFEQSLPSTMDAARLLASGGCPHGTVITAGEQTKGRGRGEGRPWKSAAGSSLACTIILRYANIASIPAALTLKTGLAVSLAVEDFAAAVSPAAPLAGRVTVKWPNDVMIDGKKAAGILTESDGGNVFIGVGVNAAAGSYPEAIAYKAVCIAEAAGCTLSGAVPPAGSGPIFLLLEKILSRLHAELEPAGTADPAGWKRRLEARLYRKGEHVRFIPGAADSPETVEGVLEGITGTGELLLAVNGGPPQPFITGELDVYSQKSD